MKRRPFLRSIGSILPFAYLPQRAKGSNERLQIAAIGVGGKGGSDFQHLARHGDVIAVCDISEKKIQYALRGRSRVAKFDDYREMFAHLGGKIDLLSVSAPDHIHAHAGQLALDLGIHLFLQTPMSHTIWEARQLQITARKKQICTQLGLQGSSSDTFRQGVEFLQAQGLGKILDVHAWTNRPLWPQSAQYSKRPSEKFSIPNGLNWDAFLGPAEDRPYHPLYQPYNWRGWQSFGTGALGDSGIHLFNLPVLGCGLQKPEKVECLLRGPVNSETYPSWAIVKYEFPGRKKGQTIPMHWYEGKIGNLSKTVTGGKNFPNLELFKGREPSASGCLIRGSKGTLYSPSIFGSKWEVYLENKWMKPQQLKSFSGALGRNGRGDSGLKDELVRAIRRGQPKSTLAGFDYGYVLTELILLGNIAMLAGGEFSWDRELGSSNRKDVNSLLTKSYRKGWEVQSA